MAVIPEDFDTAPNMSGICCLTFHPLKKNLLLICNLSHQMLLYDIQKPNRTPQRIYLFNKAHLGYTLRDANEDVHCCAKFNTSGDLIAFASVDGHLALLDSSTLSQYNPNQVADLHFPLLKKFTQKIDPSKAFNFIEVLQWWDLQRFVSGSREGIIQIWHTDSLTNGPVHSVPLKPEAEANEETTEAATESADPTTSADREELPAINDICLAPKRTYVLAATDSGQLFSVHLFKAKIHRWSESMGSAAKSVAVVQGGERIALCLEFGVVSLFLWPDIGIPVVNITLRKDEVVECMTLVNDNLLLAAFTDGVIYACCVKPARSLDEVSSHPCLTKENEEPDDVCPDTDGVSQLIVGQLPNPNRANSFIHFALTTSTESGDVCFHDLTQILREAKHYEKTEGMPSSSKKRHAKPSTSVRDAKAQRAEHDDFFYEMLPENGKKKGEVNKAEEESSSDESESEDSD